MQQLGAVLGRAVTGYNIIGCSRRYRRGVGFVIDVSRRALRPRAWARPELLSVDHGPDHCVRARVGETLRNR